jgi:hypothetical protein
LKGAIHGNETLAHNIGGRSVHDIAIGNQVAGQRCDQIVAQTLERVRQCINLIRGSVSSLGVPVGINPLERGLKIRAWERHNREVIGSHTDLVGLQ